MIVFTDLVIACSDKTPVQKSYSVWIISNVTYKIPRLHCNNLNRCKRISYSKTWSCRLQACIQWKKILEEKEEIASLHSAEQSSSRIRGKKARPHKAFSKVTFQSFKYIKQDILQTWSHRLQACIQRNKLLAQ